MKQLIFLNGTMGVGKSTVSRLLLKELTPGVWLDGDWCWRMEPFLVSEENKTMVLENITDLLGRFLQNSGYQYVLFSWVMDRQEIVDAVLRGLPDRVFQLQRYTLTCSVEALQKRLMGDVEKGVRGAEVIERSVARLPLYRQMTGSIHMDVSSQSPGETARRIAALVRETEKEEVPWPHF